MVLQTVASGARPVRRRASRSEICAENQRSPMKGYTPPRACPSARARADHAQHHNYGRHSVKPGREARHSRQGCNRAPRGSRRVRHHQSNPRRRARQRNGRFLRSRHESSPRGTSRRKIPPPRREQRGRRGSHPASAVVTIMGHVDHGKTTLLDSIRSTNVPEAKLAASPAHRRIQGCHHRQIVSRLRREIVFLDTPVTKPSPACVRASQSHRHRRARHRRR